MCSITGYSEEELLSSSFPDITHPEDLQADVDLVESLAKGEIDQYQLEKRYIRKDGQVVWVHLSVRMMRDAAGEPLYYLPMMEDITERKEAEAALKAYAARLEALNRELREFAFVASHDLQEPLRKIQTFATRLRSKCDCVFSEDGLDHLSRMEGAANRMQKLLTSLLQYSRVAANASRFTETNLGTVARDVLSELGAAIDKFGVLVELGDLPMIQADADQMRQLLHNLVDNGLKYRSRREKPVLKIWSTTEGEICKIFVQDNGIGFQEKYLDRIFKPFQRLHKSNSPYDGTGMGLAICRKIVESHGGTITAKSVPEGGSIFIIQLPFKNEGPEELFVSVPATRKPKQNSSPSMH